MTIKEQINFNGYYYMSHENRAKYYGENNYSTWCKNYTFKAKEYNDKIFMVDTYWGCSPSNDLTIEVTEDNIDLFELQVDITEVKSVKEEEREQYGWENVTSVITGNTGSSRVTHYVPKDLNKDIDYTIAQIDKKIDQLNWKLQHCLDLKREIAEKGEVPEFIHF